MEVERLRKLFSLKDAIQLELRAPVVIEMTWLGAATAAHRPIKSKHIHGSPAAQSVCK